MIGREKEQDYLNQCLESGRPEFLVVYGRRRVGKTYLVREFFHEYFAFYATGVTGEKTSEQLRVFHESLRRYGSTVKSRPADWFEAFGRLRDLLSGENVPREPKSGKKIVFLDELPWMDTPRSSFKSAFEYFWNSYGSAQDDLLLIACGSATSWIIRHLLNDTGGFYNRVTRQIHLQPFTLAECEQMLSANGFLFPRSQILECYMVFGGIPHYLNCLDKRLSLAQNIDTLLLHPQGQLHHEYDRLLDSLFRHAQKHRAVIEALTARRRGLLRTELAADKKIGDGEPLTTVLAELEQCGFIRKYHDFYKKKNGSFFQLTDPFMLFHLYFRGGREVSGWGQFMDTSAYYAWRGNAFETVCFNHIPQIKAALGISGIISQTYAWRSKAKEGGVQIDLLIDRRDDVIDLCEAKFSNGVYEISKEEYEKLQHRRTVFQKETGTGKAVHIVLISATGVKRGMYTDIAQVILDGDALFT